MEFFHEPSCFAAVYLKGADQPGLARVLEGPVPDWKYFGGEGTGNGAAGRTYGFPRFRTCSFLPRFPFATVTLDLSHPDAKTVRRTAQSACNRRQRRSFALIPAYSRKSVRLVACA
jgi:hypothetical protein